MTSFHLWLVLFSSFCLFLRAEEEGTCSWDGVKDPNLKEMVYDVGDGPQTFLAYVEPPITSFYGGSAKQPRGTTKVHPEFEGFGGKFINMSNRPVRLYWESSPGGYMSPMGLLEPFSADGTGTFPTHRFFLVPEGANPKTGRLIEFVMGEYPENLYVYDPYLVEGDDEATEVNLQRELDDEERTSYDQWAKTLLFNEQYFNFTGRSYLVGYPKKATNHFMWRADFFGQEHWVTSRETHFDRLPPFKEMKSVTATGEERILTDDQPRNLQEYRVQDSTILNMTLRVLSCAPRVFEIKNFLSPEEVRHILEIAGGLDLHESLTGSRGDRIEDEPSTIQKTRTSFNSWVGREESDIIDAIYRRSADLIRIPEALLRYRGKTEHPYMPSRGTIAEQLQLVHYGPSQEYTAHHDFGYSAIYDERQSARFLTLLLYLNEGMEGGETAFPRWANAETFEKLKVKPELGKAVLFYNQLPDGNLDDFSQHAAEPVVSGEKWLINLWVWDPIFE